MNLKPLAVVTLCLAGIACATRTAPTPAAAGPEVSGTTSLTVLLLGLESESGEVAVALYDSADSFEQRSGAVVTGWVEPRNGRATWSVDALEPGEYAVAAYHDLNGNRRLDRSTLGPPTEPYGFSNEARGAFGPPKFRKAAISIRGPLTIEITLR